MKNKYQEAARKDDFF